ncbi:putative Zn-dependent protease containing TPR repeats [Citrifermentans bremense]|uniref:Putative Zn-dependent protease containing TPR repeats n=1 Tax=Citrifermentans bremense TaxID=60035 RepID=A0A6S6M2V3_9BACT|nr:M48 family metallopeptidase [Citrifermentans bremense]BCG45695.1 putative Zn-dependent protease containing TPR repeats [Citrifermentans bremense]
MRTSTMSLFFALACLCSVEAHAGWQDKLQNLMNPESREGKILSGATQVVSSSQEMSYSTERTVGESLALESMQRFGKPVPNEALQKYVNLVGNAVARNSRRSTIPYQFVVLDSPVRNAFAAPGGMIFVSRGLLDVVDNEAELAAVLAHEVGHVAEKHALKSIRRAQFLQGVGTISAATMKGGDGKKFESMIGDLQSTLFDKGLDQGMEYEADLAALETAYRTGYDPAAMVSVLQKLKKLEASDSGKGSWFSTHPPLDERIARLSSRLEKYPDHASLAKVPARFAKYVKVAKKGK